MTRRWNVTSLVTWIFLSIASVAGAFLPRYNVHATSRAIITTSTSHLASSSVNPNDLESPEERERRMEMVRNLQRSFYSDSDGITKNFDGVFRNVPLWRVQWTEIPGYQNVLNCHVPHYTHLFMSVLNGPQPWYFGHVYLPGGSENLDNPDYRLRRRRGGDGPAEKSQAAHTGTLMKVSDYEQLEDGRLLLIAQALGRFEVVEATQHSPYGIATVELTPDRELIEKHYGAARELASAEGMDEDGDGADNADAGADDADVYAWGAARVAAVTEAMHWESFEYRNVAVAECLDGGVGISPVANFDATNAPLDRCDVTAAMKEYLRDPAKGSSGEKPAAADASSCSSDRVLDLERSVWIGVDYMIQLLAAVNTNPDMHIPVPTQILGLLPSNETWPEGFKLDTYVSRLALEEATVGTMSKSPFVVVDDAAPAYPPLRRAQRLSFAIWCLLDTVLAGYDPAAQTRQSVLELESTAERLEAAKRGLDAINTALRQVLTQRQ